VIKNFEYFAPKTVEDATSLLSQYREESKIIAGGQSLLILMRQGLVAPKYLIDIKTLSALDYVNFDEKQGLRIGSLTTHRTIEKSSLVQNGFGVLAETEESLASIEVRNWGTIGGNLCHGDPAGDLAPILIALKGKLKMVSVNGERNMEVLEFFKDYFETALHHDEILTEIQVPSPPPCTGTAYSKFNLIENDYAIVSAAVSITLNLKNNTCNDTRIVLGAAAPIPIRAKKAESILVGKEIRDDLLKEASQLASEEASPISDIHASEEYRRELVRVLVMRVGEEALERAKKA
jgi:carbon-monoxide dehydrogenase medium subunit